MEGAWTDQGKPALLFRIGRNADNTSCYAWLNAYSNWSITGPGTIDPGLMRVIGNLWQTDNRSLTVDVIGKNATYNWQGVRADGLVFN